MVFLEVTDEKTDRTATRSTLTLLI